MIAQASKPIFEPRASPRAPALRASSAPATFLGTVQVATIAGLALAVAYAYLGLHLTSWETIFVWAIKGLFYGFVAGVALYTVVIGLRVAITVLAAVLQIAFWCALGASLFYVLFQ